MMHNVLPTFAQAFWILQNNHTGQGFRSAEWKRMGNFTRDLLDQKQRARVIFLQKRSRQKRFALPFNLILNLSNNDKNCQNNYKNRHNNGKLSQSPQCRLDLRFSYTTYLSFTLKAFPTIWHNG